MRRFRPPTREHVVRVVVMMPVVPFFAVMMTAFIPVFMVMMAMLVFLLVVVMTTFVPVFVVMMAMLTFLLVVMMTAFFSVFVVVMLMHMRGVFCRQFFQFRLQSILFFHGGEDILAGEQGQRRGDERGIRIFRADECDGGL